MKLEHVGIAVSSIKESAAFYRASLGLEIFSEEEVPSQKVRVAFLKAGETFLELLEATSPDSVIARFIEKRGAGLHHLAFETFKISEQMEELKKLGFPLIDERPRTGARGHKVCFLNPKATQNVLIELVVPHG